MRSNDWLFILVALGILLFVIKPLAGYLAMRDERVCDEERAGRRLLENARLHHLFGEETPVSEE